MSTVIDHEGMWLINKPVGISSFGLVAQVRRSSGVRKVGHAGTLDPLAEGLMIVLVGKTYTKQAESYSKLDKSYDVQMCLGKISSTGDEEGEKSVTGSTQPTLANITKVLASFVGEQQQMPPVYSAIKINGRPAYKLARAGKTIEMTARTVQISQIKLVDYTYPIVRFRVDVSSGTYIRSLVSDIGQKLGTGAYMSGLVRTRIGQYSLSDAIRLE